ncbi:MAG: hypothetical protein FWC09_00645 [Lachnospiraceae bacterium]|nr:hypothetical protein [Lachnospiraceae bacterium]
MAKLELHVRNYKLLYKYITEDYFKYEIDIISVGDEGCIFHMPSSKEIISIFNTIINAGLQPKLITPKVVDIHFEKIMDLLQTLVNNHLDYQLVINDFGVLYEAYNRKILPSQVFVGRSLSRTLEDTPWHFLLLENEEFSDDMISNTMADYSKYKFLKNYGITGIETSLLPEAMRGLARIQKWGWKINCHLANCAVAFARKCAYAKHKNLEIGNCVNHCHESIDITMSQYSNGIDYQPCHNQLDKKLLDFNLLGNVLYRRIEMQEEWLIDADENITFVIHDYDLEKSDLEHIINTFRRTYHEEITN